MSAAPLPMVWNNFDWNQQRVEEFAHAGSLGNPTGMAVSALILFICGFGVRGSMDRAHRLFDFKSSTELEKIFGTETLIKNVRDLVQANQKVFTAEHWADFGGFDPLGYINKVPQWAKKLETRPEMVEEIRNSSFGNHLPLIASESSDDLDLDPSKIALIFAHIVIREYLHSDEYDKRLPKALARCFIAILYFVNEKKKLAPLGAVYLPPLHNDDLGIDQRFILPLAHIAVILAESPYGKHYLLQQALAQLDRLQRVDQGSTALLLLAMGDSDSPATYRALLKLRAQGHPKADKLIRNALGSSSHRKKLLKAEHQICLLRLVKSDIDPKYLDLSL